MSESEFKPLDLTVAEDAREFLDSLVINGRKVSKFQNTDGKKLSVKELSDKQAVDYAIQLHQELFDGEAYVDTRIDHLDIKYN